MNARGLRKLFSSVRLGPSTLQHRVVMASLARSRSAQPGDAPATGLRVLQRWLKIHRRIYGNDESSSSTDEGGADF
jgi:hypothetical protein